MLGNHLGLWLILCEYYVFGYLSPCSESKSERLPLALAWGFMPCLIYFER